MALAEHHITEIRNYLRAGELTDPLVMGVLANDLLAVMTTGGDEQLAVVKDLLLYIYSRVPAEAWGSRRRMMEWRVARQTERGVPLSPITQAELECADPDVSPLVQPGVLRLIAG